MKTYLDELEREQGDLKPATRRAYESVWRCYLVYLAERRLDPVRASAGVARGFLRRVRPSTAIRYARLLEAVYGLQVERNAVSGNPFAELPSILTATEERGPSVALKLGSVRELIRALPEPENWQEHRDQAIVVLGAAAGLRFRELRELKVTQFIETSRGLEVQPRGRTVRSRELLLDRNATAFLRNWLRERDQLQFPRTTQFAFPARRGGPIATTTFYRRVRALIEALYGEDALPRFGVGVLRATFANRFRETDDVAGALHALGHRRITSTLRYLGQIKPIQVTPSPDS